MNTKSNSENEKRWDKIFSFESYDDEIKHDTQMLMFAFLSEVEKYQNVQGIKKNRLAELIHTSASYITQLFRGSKPLNFETLAKIQKALSIKFQISSFVVSNAMELGDENYFLDVTSKYMTQTGHWCWKRINTQDYNFSELISTEKLGKEIYNVKQGEYADQALTA